MEIRPGLIFIVSPEGLCDRQECTQVGKTQPARQGAAF